MAHYDPNDLPPSYEEATRGPQEPQWCDQFSFLLDKPRLCINVILSVVAVCLHAVFWFTDVFDGQSGDVTKYCNKLEYHVGTVPRPVDFPAIAAIVMTFLLCLALIGVASLLEDCSTTKKLTAVILVIWVLAMHLIFLSMTVDVLKDIAEIPYPYFFQRSSIYDFYCGEDRIHRFLSPALVKLDKRLRKSFPSRRSAVYGFCITFVYLYIDHFDIEIGPRTSQQFILIVVGSYMSAIQFVAWEDRENHLASILVGVVIGSIYAMIAIRSLVGSIFYSRVYALFKSTSVRYARPRPPPSYFDHVDLIRTPPGRRRNPTEVPMAELGDQEEREPMLIETEF